MPNGKKNTAPGTKPAPKAKNAPASLPWPAERIEKRLIGDLTAYPNNSRIHSDDQIDLISKSITEFGWTTPVLVDEGDGVICGHARIRAAQKLGFAEVPVMVARGWTEAQKKAYVIADNQIPQSGASWDYDLLKVELNSLAKLDFDLKLIGFDDLQLVQFMAQPNGNDPDEVPEPPVVPVSRTGDLWILGNHRLLCGDCTSASDVAACLGKVKPHLMVTDPPYGVSYSAGWRNKAMPYKNDPSRWKDGAGRATGAVTNDDRSDWRETWVLFTGDVAYVWHAATEGHIVAESLMACDFTIRSQIIWAKNQLVISRGHYHPQHEPLFYAVRKSANGHWCGGRTQTTLWQINKPVKSETGHSTQKPVECMKRPIENNSSVGQAVYDPFVGSGTTIIAAEMTQRSCFAIEIDPIYIDVALQRWQNFTNKQATLESTGQTFEQVKQERLDHAKENPKTKIRGRIQTGSSRSPRGNAGRTGQPRQDVPG
jgi:DNA modification methylase